MKVLLVSANPERMPYPVFPIGISQVAANLQPDHRVYIHDVVKDGADTLARSVTDFEPDLVGIGLRNVDDTRPDGQTYLEHYRLLANQIRKATKAPVVLGGSAFTLFPEEYLEALGADLGIVGEGESFRQLADAMQSGKTIEQIVQEANIPGLCSQGSPPSPYRQRGTAAQHSRSAADLLSWYLSHGGMANLQTKRGCPLSCVYCTYPRVEGKTVRNTPIDSLIDDLEWVIGCGARYVFFVDSAFNVDVEHTSLLAEAIIRRGISVQWGAFFAPYNLTDEYAQLLKRAGLVHAEFGTESLCDSVLQAYGKPFTVSQVFSAHEAMGQAGVHRAHFLLMGGPSESHDSVETTLGHAAQLTETVFFPYVGVRAYPDTPLYQIALDQGLIRPEQSLFSPVFYHAPGLDPQWLDARLERAAAQQPNIILDKELREKAPIMEKLYRRGRVGPLWELLIR